MKPTFHFNRRQWLIGIDRSYGATHIFIGPIEMVW